MTLTEYAQQQLDDLARQDLVRSRLVVTARQAGSVCVAGRWFTNFASNDYLGLSQHPALAAAAHRAIDEFGNGATASRLVIGNSAAHEALEAALADWLGYEAVCLFNSGVAANTGVIATLADGAVTVFSDALNHASIIDGCRLSRAEVVVYPHGDCAGLRQRLLAFRVRYPARRALIVTESVFSMDGDCADLRALRLLADEFGAALVVDEAHALGALGPAGRGACAAFGVVPDVLIGTFGKALGSYGAFACASRAVIDLLWNRARSLVFTTGLPPAVIGAACAAVAIVRSAEGEAMRASLHARIVQMRTELKRGLAPLVLQHNEKRRMMDRENESENRTMYDSCLVVSEDKNGYASHDTLSENRTVQSLVDKNRGFDAAKPDVNFLSENRTIDDFRVMSEESENRTDVRAAIFPVIIGDARTTLEIAAELRRSEILVGAVRPPTVPAGTARLRLAVTAQHSEEQIAAVIHALRQALKGEEA